jgi:hypothetical protein
MGKPPDANINNLYVYVIVTVYGEFLWVKSKGFTFSIHFAVYAKFNTIQRKGR